MTLDLLDLIGDMRGFELQSKNAIQVQVQSSPRNNEKEHVFLLIH